MIKEPISKIIIIKYYYKLLIKFSSEIIVPSLIIKNELFLTNKTITIFNNPLIINTQPDYGIISNNAIYIRDGDK